MKLLTTIKPRSNGTVTLAGADGAIYIFTADETGALVCDVPDEALVARVLAAGTFEPADEADFAHAEALLKANAADATGEGQGQDDGDDEDDDVDFDALPVEANTPPVSAPAKSARKRRG